MGYHQRSGRGSSRERRTPRREKAKARSKELDRRPGVRYAEDVNSGRTPEEILDKTVVTLQNLGNQVFALSPFSEHFSRWIVDLRLVMSEFESSPAVNVDDEFLKQRSQILSDLELELKKIRQDETLCDEAIKQLSENRVALEKMEKEHAVKMKDLETRKKVKVKTLSQTVDELKKESERIASMRTGLFRGLSKKAKAQKQEEATKRLDSARAELSQALEFLDEERDRLQKEYEKKNRPIADRISLEEKEVENRDVDGSLQARKVVCEALVKSVKEFVEKKNSLK